MATPARLYGPRVTLPTRVRCAVLLADDSREHVVQALSVGGRRATGELNRRRAA